jgi:PRTRC genetic system protein C
MPLSVTSLVRSFKFRNGNTDLILNDPNPAMLPEEVMEFFSNTYPELTTATVRGPEVEDDRIIYSFRTTIGTKG